MRLNMSRDKQFVLAKAAKWVDEDKSLRIAAQKQIMNEMDVRSAAVTTREESRNTDRAMLD